MQYSCSFARAGIETFESSRAGIKRETRNLIALLIHEEYRALALAREELAYSSVPDDVRLHPRIITPDVGHTAWETLLRHVFVSLRYEGGWGGWQREERNAMRSGRDFHRSLRVPGSSRAKIGHIYIFRYDALLNNPPLCTTSHCARLIHLVGERGLISQTRLINYGDLDEFDLGVPL